MPAAVATRASLIAGAIIPKDALELCPKPLKVSRIDTTVPKRPINGDVEAIIESQAKPLVAFFSATFLQTAKSSVV